MQRTSILLPKQKSAILCYNASVRPYASLLYRLFECETSFAWLIDVFPLIHFPLFSESCQRVIIACFAIYFDH